MFKPKKNRGIRARASTADDNEDEKQDINNRHQPRLSVHEVRQLQQQRARKGGLPLDALLTGDQSRQLVLDDPAARGAGDDSAQLATGFAKEEVKVDTEEDIHMVHYIEREMARRTGTLTNGAPMSDADVLKSMHAPQAPDVLLVPDNLKAPKRNDLEIAGTWVSGISEVAVPMQYKMENIEAAEAAKKAMLGTGQETVATGPVKLKRGLLPKSFGGHQATRQHAEPSFVAQAMREERKNKKRKS